MRQSASVVADERAVSPVIGTVLLLAIVVVAGSATAVVAFGYGDALTEPAPPGHFDTEYIASGDGNSDDRPFVIITNNLGKTANADNILIKDDSGNSIRWSDVWTAGDQVKAGEYVHLDGFNSDSTLDPICERGDSYRIIYQDDNQNTLLVTEWEASTDPQLPSGSPSDSDGDGIPDWC